MIGGGFPVPPASTIQEALNTPTAITSSCAPSSPAGPARASNLADTLAQHHDVVIIDNLATKQ
jgi:hypothetical protein